MERSHQGQPWRCLGVWLASTLALGTLTVWVAPEISTARQALATRTISAHSFADLLVWVCAGALLVCSAWLWLVTSLIAADAARGRVEPEFPGCPAAVRRLLLMACGVALLGGLVTPAHTLAPAADPAPTAPADSTDRSRVKGLPLPDRASSVPPPSRRRSDRATSHSALGRGGHVVVRHGDTLWAIAARSLVPEATDADIDERWRAIHHLNRTVIGADPDVIQPTQRLHLPRA